VNGFGAIAEPFEHAGRSASAAAMLKALIEIGIRMETPIDECWETVVIVSRGGDRHL
jgi:hypothetical protein